MLRFIYSGIIFGIVLATMSQPIYSESIFSKLFRKDAEKKTEQVQVEQTEEQTSSVSDGEKAEEPAQVAEELKTEPAETAIKEESEPERVEKPQPKQEPQAEAMKPAPQTEQTEKAEPKEKRSFFARLFSPKKKEKKQAKKAPQKEMTVDENEVGEEIELSEEEKAPAAQKVEIQKSVSQMSQEQSAEMLFEQGMTLFRQFKFEDALGFFVKAKVYAPNDQKILDYIARTKQILGRGGTTAGIYSEWAGERRQVAEQEYFILVENHVIRGEKMARDAMELWQSGGAVERQEAQQQLGRARAELRQAFDALKRIGVGVDVKEHSDRIQRDMTQIDAIEANWNRQLTLEAQREAKEKAIHLEEQQQEYEDEKLDRLLLQAKRDYLNGEYDKAEKLSRKILRLWPDHEDAMRILDKSIRHKDIRNEEEIRRKSREEWKRVIEKIRMASIAYSDTLTYPENWDKIKQRQTKGAREVEDPEWMRDLKKKMETPVVLNLQDNTLDEAMSLLKDQTQVNYQIDTNSLPDLPRISIVLRDLRYSSALSWILRSISTEDRKVVYILQDEVVYITTKEQVSALRRPEKYLYDVTDLTTSFTDHGLETGGLNRSGAGGLSGVSGGENREGWDADFLISIIRDTVYPDSWQNPDASVGIVQFERGKMLITQSREAHREIEELLAMFRRLSTMQVSIEARFIVSQDDDLLDIGVDWKGFKQTPLSDSGIRNEGSGAYSDRDSLDADTRTAVLLGSAGSSIPKGDRYVPGTTANLGMLAQVAVLDPIRASLVIHAVNEKRSMNDILAPRLTVLNNHQGYIMRSEEMSYVKTFTEANGTVMPTVDRVPVGEVLVVRPTVSSDKRYITMELSPQVYRNVNLESRELRFPVSYTSGESIIRDIITVSVEVPNVQLWQLETRVQVPDGGIIFVGGKMGNTETRVTRGVPILSKIPILGRLFRSDGSGTELDNLLVLVRARILLFEEIEATL